MFIASGQRRGFSRHFVAEGPFGHPLHLYARLFRESCRGEYLPFAGLRLRAPGSRSPLRSPYAGAATTGSSFVHTVDHASMGHGFFSAARIAGNRVAAKSRSARLPAIVSRRAQKSACDRQYSPRLMCGGESARMAPLLRRACVTQSRSRASGRDASNARDRRQ
jgi:hypothetical protein